MQFGGNDLELLGSKPENKTVRWHLHAGSPRPPSLSHSPHLPLPCQLSTPPPTARPLEPCGPFPGKSGTAPTCSAGFDLQVAPSPYISAVTFNTRTGILPSWAHFELGFHSGSVGQSLLESEKSPEVLRCP